MKVYYACDSCNIYYNNVDYNYAITHTETCPDCGQEMSVRPETPRP